METKITRHAFTWGSQSYFRGNAHLLEIGHYGQKKDPIGPKGYIDPHGKVKAEHLAPRVKLGTRTKVDWNEVSKADLEADADLNFFGLGKSGAMSFDLGKAKSAGLELVNLNIDEGPLTTMLNTDAGGALKFLADEGNDARIVSEVWIVVDAELGEHFATQGQASASVKAFGSSLSLTVSGGKRGLQTVTISRGTTFAYKLHKVRDWNKGKTRIENMETDYKGMS